MALILLTVVACLVLQSTYAASVEEYKSYKNYRVYQVKGDEPQIRKMLKMVAPQADEMPLYTIDGSKASVLLAPQSVEVFEKAARTMKLDSSLSIKDYSKIIQMEKRDRRNAYKFPWTAYFDVDGIYNYLKNASKNNPHSTEVIVGGKSYEGRQLLGIRINTHSETNKPVVFIESGIHAREWIAPATTTYFINQLLTSSNPDIINLKNQFDWRIFPTVNPDGYQYSFDKDRMWRETRSKTSEKCYGVDANRNWNYNWMKYGATQDPCDRELYAGPKPFSEIETKSLSQYVSGIKNLLAYIGFHSYAQMLLVPYSDSVDHISNYDDLMKIGKTSLEYGSRVNNVTYHGPATAAEILYKASGGSMDWVRYALGTPLVFTYELRGNGFYWPPDRIPEIGDEYTQMVLGLFTEAKKQGYF